MFNRTRPTFNREDIGCISHGPSYQTHVCLMTFRDNTNKLKWYGDLRIFVWSVKYGKWFPTQKGITMPQKVLLDLNNAIFKLPEEVPVLKEKETKLIIRIPKYKTCDICLSVVHYEGESKLDFREYVKSESGGFEGFSNKGVRIFYGMKNEISSLLITLYNKMEDLKNGVKEPVAKQDRDPNYNQIRQPKTVPPIEEETPF